MRISSKGQVTVPAHTREAAGVLPDIEADFVLQGGVVRSDAPKQPSRGERMIAHLRAHKGDVRMTTDEIMALIRGGPD
jgi:bifunctional DNA-binding transcriptional regulator/antitoxin component of YhaV-PrlF toxin-antitoxin module